MSLWQGKETKEEKKEQILPHLSQKPKTAKPQREALGDEPSNTGARASTDIPQAKASPKKEAKASPKKEAKPEEPKTKTKPVKKDIPHKNP